MILTNEVVGSALRVLDDDAYIKKWSKEFSQCRAITRALLSLDPPTIFCFGFILGKHLGSTEAMEKQFNPADDDL